MRIKSPQANEDKGRKPYDIEALEARLLTIGVRERYGYDLELCDAQELKTSLKRLAKQMNLVPGHLQTRLLREEALLSSLLDELFSSNGKSNFSAKRFSTHSKKYVLPRLKTYPSLRFWHLGCSDVKMTIALVEELKAAKLMERTKIYATELSDLGLEQAKTHKLASKLKSLQKNVSYFGHSFLSDASFNSFHAILMSSRITGLTSEARERVRTLLFESTVSLGFIYCLENQLLEEESFLNAFEPLGSNTGWYQKRV